MTRYNAKPITGPDGIAYPSLGKAAKALGVSRKTLERHFERFGSLENVGKLTGTRIAVAGPDGTIYPSKADAARALGVNVETIKRHIQQHGNLDLVGTATTRCIWKGKVFPSITAAAEAIGIAPHSVSYHLARYGNLDRAGHGYDRPFGQQRAAKPFRIGPLEFSSTRKAAKAFGVSEFAFHRMISREASPASRERLMAKAMALNIKGKKKNRQMEEAF